MNLRIQQPVSFDNLKIAEVEIRKRNQDRDVPIAFGLFTARLRFVERQIIQPQIELQAHTELAGRAGAPLPRAVARSGAQLSFVSRENYVSLMQSNPTLPLKVLRVLAAEVHSARNAMLHR